MTSTRYALIGFALAAVYTAIPLGLGYHWGYRSAVETKGAWADALGRTIVACEPALAAHEHESSALSDTLVVIGRAVVEVEP